MDVDSVNKFNLHLTPGSANNPEPSLTTGVIVRTFASGDVWSVASDGGYGIIDAVNQGICSSAVGPGEI